MVKFGKFFNMYFTRGYTDKKYYYISWMKLKLSVTNFQTKYRIFHNCKKTEIRSKMNVFERAPEDKIKKLILSLSSKSCDLDRISTRVLTNCLDILITPITDIISISMETSTFPHNFKEAHVRPLLKNISSRKRTEKLQACIQLEFYFQNIRKGSSQSAASSYKK